MLKPRSPLQIMPQDCDVLIVGAGPAGLSAAITAAQQGCSVVVIERKPAIGYSVHCGELVPRALGLEFPIGKNAIIQEIEDLKTILPNGKVTTISAPSYMLDRGQFERELAEEASQNGAIFLLHTALLGFDNQRAVVDHGGTRRAIQAAVIIGADGARSTVGKYLRLRNHELLQGYQETIAGQPSSASSRIYLNPRFQCGYGWLFPRGELVHAGVGGRFRSRRELQAAYQFLRSQLQTEGLCSQGPIVRRSYGLIPVGGMLPTIGADNVILVGDAAGLTHPITGAGIATAVLSGAEAGTAAGIAVGGGLEQLSSYYRTIRLRWGEELAWASHKRGIMQDQWREFERVITHSWVAFPDYYRGRQEYLRLSLTRKGFGHE